jgi:hypothetical protein
MTDWVPIVSAAIGSGALGSVITAYGTQTRERRQASAQAREAIRQVQHLTYRLRTQEQVDAALDSLETSAMLAGLPKKLTALNRQALWIHWQVTSSYANPNPPDDAEAAGEVSDLAFATDHIADDTTQLLIDATWHPVLSAPRRWWRTRRLSAVMDTWPRPGPRPRDKRQWERKTIRRRKQARKKPGRPTGLRGNQAAH